MHKLQSFALSCGSKISKPHIERTFYPVLDRKFICVSQKSLCQSEDYDYYDDVIFHIKPYLEKEGVQIIEIGNSDKNPLFYSKNYRHLNRLQSSYLISNSLLYLGNLNLYNHIASYYEKPAISPLNNQYHDTIKPYWDRNNLCKIITAKTNLKPTFSETESPKTINEVPPELISSYVLDSLSISHNLNKIETIYTGDEYKTQIVDLVPGQFNLPSMNLKGAVNLRMDKFFDLNFLQSCVVLDSINLVMDKHIPLEYLNLIKDKINFISIFIDHKTPKEYIELLSSLGKPLNLLCLDSKKLKEIQLKFIDYQVKVFGKKSKKDLKAKNYSDLKFLSKRNIIANGKAYNSYLSLSLDKNISTVKDQKEFWEDLPFCRVFRESS